MLCYNAITKRTSILLDVLNSWGKKQKNQISWGEKPTCAKKKSDFDLTFGVKS